MIMLFYECKELEYFDLSNFNTSNVTVMSGMFSGCKKLKEIKGINQFNNNNITEMPEIFQRCNELKNIDSRKFKFESNN